MTVAVVQNKETQLVVAEKKLDADRSKARAKYKLACHYLDSKNYIPALSLLELTKKQIKKTPHQKVPKKDVKAKISECKKHVEEQAKRISEIATKNHLHGDIAKIKSGKISKGMKAKLKKHDELLPIEAALIRLFTSGQNYFSLLNAHLRGDAKKVDEIISGHQIDKTVTVSFLKETTPILKHGLAKMPSLAKKYPDDAQKRTVYRGMGLKAEHIQKMQKEMSYTNAGFASASRSMGTALSFASNKHEHKESVLFITEGKTGVPIHELSHYQGEKEVLFSPGTSFSISEIKKVTKDDDFAKKQVHNFSKKYNHLWVVRMKEK